MKIYMKKYGLMIVIFLFLIIWFFKGTIETYSMITKQIEDNAMSRKYCEENINTLDGVLKNNCTDILNAEPMTYLKNFYVLFAQVKFHTLSKFNLYLILIVMIPIAFIVCSKLKNNYIKNYLSKDTYKNFRKSLFKTAYSSIWIFPLAILILFIFCAFLTKNFSNTIPQEGYMIWGKEVTSNPIFFSICYIFHILCYSFMYANIFLIVARKNHNPFIALIISFLVMIGLELFLEIVVFQVLKIIFPFSDYGILFNVMNSVTFNEQYGLLPTLLIGIFWCVISYLLARLCYQNQEKFIIDCEKKP